MPAHVETRRIAARRLLEFGVPVGTSEILNTAYSARGSALTTMVLDQSGGAAKLTAGVISCGWPSWGTALSMKRLTLKWILVRDKVVLELARDAFPRVTVLLWGQTQWQTLPAVDIVAFNGPCEQSTAPFPFGNVYLWDWDPQLRWTGWYFKNEMIKHVQCGGVSDFAGRIVVGTGIASLKFPTIMHVESPAGDLGSILQSKTEGIEFLVAPILAKLDTPCVHEVSKNCFHPRGLFPLAIPDADVIAKFVFGRKSKVVQRKLTAEESLQVYDVSPGIYGRWSPSSKRLVLDLLRVPIKVLVAVATSLILVLGLRVRGGVDQKDEELDREQVVQHDVDQKDEELDREQVVQHDVEVVPQSDVIPGALGLPASWRTGESGQLEEAAATKVDDAEVPIHLWNDVLLEDLGRDTSFTVEEEQALEVLRRMVLCKWRYRLTRCFCRWMRCSECEFMKSDELFKVYPIELPESRREKRKPLRPPKWRGCMKCKVLDGKHSSWVQHDYLFQGRGGYSWEGLHRSSSEVIYDSGSFGGRGGYVWKPGGLVAYRKWRNKFLPLKSVCGRASLDAGVDCIVRASAASAWEWDGGSRPFFWRWGREYWKEARDGARVWVGADLPSCKEKQRVPKDPDIKAKVRKKVNKVRERGYLGAGIVKSLTSFFEVLKGLDDIRMVYNATSSGLNDAVWAPWFSLPTVESHLRAVDPDTYMADNDIGEMFLNFMLDVELRPFAGVDLSSLFPEEMFPGVTELYARWERMLMGFRPSPYLTTRDLMRLEPMLKGNRLDPKNVFRWERVVLNLPGMSSYTPRKQWVYRVRKDNVLAADLFIYIDDLRPTGPSKRECWAAAHQVGGRLTWFGLQDAARKRRKASQKPGAWAGTVIHTDGEEVCVLVSKEKWDKTRKWIEWMKMHTDAKQKFCHKELERCRGFLIYVSRTYRPFIPFLRGVHQTLESWRQGRGEDGWKLTDREIEHARREKEDLDGPPAKGGDSQIGKGGEVEAAPRLFADVDALSKMTQFAAPPRVVRRSRKTASAKYFAGDASGKGFGNAIVVEGICHGEFGYWSGDVEKEDSNFKELANLVNGVTRAYEAGYLKKTELFVFTDNAVAEGAYYNGGSNRNKKLNELVFRLWKLQMEGDFVMHMYHIAGTRMIECGVDGLSRGDKSEGIMQGVDLLTFLPIHKSPFERSPGLRSWIRSWWDTEYGPLHEMEPEDWFTETNRAGNFLWNVPPAAGAEVVELLCGHVHRRPDSMHIFLIPRLCTSKWRKQLLKVADVDFYILPQHPFWAAEMHEPLLMIFRFPLLPHDISLLLGNLKTPNWWTGPDVICGVCKKPVNRWNGIICGNYLSRRGKFRACRKGWHGKCYVVHSDDRFPQSMLEDDEDGFVDDPSEGERFKSARNGDNYLCPFQCDLCQFRNLYLRDPLGSVEDEKMMCYIRRAVLDGFWGRASGTVSGNLGQLRGFHKIACEDFGLMEALPEMGPFPLMDTFGIGSALVMLKRSMMPGKYGDHIQYDTLRKYRSAFSNVWGASVHTMQESVMARATTKLYVTSCPTNGLWFERFMSGVHSRMGDDHRPDTAISSFVMKKMLQYAEADWHGSVDVIERRFLVRAGLFLVLAFLGALRGEEVPRLVRKEFIKLNKTSMREGRQPHLVITLYGRFKNESNVARCHVMNVVCQTRSGIRGDLWVARAIETEDDSKNKFLFSDDNGKRERGGVYEEYMFTLLERVQVQHPEHIPAGLEVRAAYGLPRSCRRGANSEAQNAPNKDCEEKDINRNNRWRAIERAKTKRASMNMLQLYTDTRLTLTADLKFSSCL